MKILITGANGFIGSSLVKELIDDYELNLLIRKTSNIQRISSVIHKTKVFYGDIREKNSLIEPIKNCDIIIHTAAVLRCVDNKTYFQVNYQGTKNLVEVIFEHGKNLKGIIYFSSLAAAGPSLNGLPKQVGFETPVSYYGKSKFLAEKEILKCKDVIKTVVLRPSAVYGPYDKDMFLYFKMASMGFFPYFAKNFSIQFTYIKDIIRIVKEILKNFEKINSDVFFIAEEKCYNVFEIRDILSKINNKKILLIKLPYSIAYLYAFLNEKITYLLSKKPAVFNRDKLKELSYSYWGCCSDKILKYINFKYTPLIEGLFETYMWYKENKWL
ncbi:MAG: NAD(P)-dependent oxidoreductase [Elusimicrobiota bacterium]|nr:NAD(P)-dependent oxidoreductase [Endomicrobiia bacterium]MDW8164898.1 NAD(P)-dependent oxidoreductase [Elusimicrobiota bacterium]